MDNCILDGYPKLGLDNLTSDATKPSSAELPAC